MAPKSFLFSTFMYCITSKRVSKHRKKIRYRNRRLLHKLKNIHFRCTINEKLELGIF